MTRVPIHESARLRCRRFSAGAALLLLVLGIACATRSLAEPAEFVIDPEHVTVGFLVEHLGYAKVLGFFRVVEGTFTFDEARDALSHVRVVVATDSVYTNHEDRDDHLRSGDFLDSRSYPEMIFTADSARPSGEGSFEISGQLELLGQSLPLTLTADVNKSAAYPIGRSDHVIGVSARGTLRRSAYGMLYGVENGWVGDEVELIIELEARRR
jgi:polyisoprenoid-binding protein YceI